MKILVVSDTHGAVFESAISPMENEKNIDLMIHCGDKYRDAEKLAAILNIKKYYRVPGNCDYDVINKKTSLLLELENKRVLVTHGHLEQVKDNLDILKMKAIGNKVDIVLFGHTHKSYNKIENSILYFNPGSTILPKDGNASYGVLDISKNDIKSRIVLLN